jgi:hypothetical protein
MVEARVLTRLEATVVAVSRRSQGDLLNHRDGDPDFDVLNQQKRAPQPTEMRSSTDEAATS